MIVAMGGASLRPEDYDPRLNDFVLSLARSGRPRVCFVGTASGDSPTYVSSFYRSFSAHHDCELADLALFERTVADLRGFVLSQDVIWVGGGTRPRCWRCGACTGSTSCCARRGSRAWSCAA